MPIDLSESNFYDTVANTEGTAVVQFTAPWCGPCRMLTPRLEELSTELDVTYYKVDVDDNGQLARDFTIMSVPTLQFYKNGQLVKTEVGAKSKKDLTAIIDNL